MKYVIEFEDEPNDDGYYKCMDAPWWSSSWSIIGKLTPYDEAFAGYQESAYKKGLEDAWAACRKIVCYEIDGGYPIVKMLDLFDRDDLPKILSDYTAAEAIAKLKAYDKQNSINVGDEVENTETLQKGVVYEVVPDQVNGFYLAGRQVHFCWLKSEVRKTGRHFDEVDRLLERMRE